MTGNEIKKIASNARNEFPYNSDPVYKNILAAEAGDPVPVYSPDGHIAYRLVPYIIDNKVCGFATITNDGTVSKLGIFGGTAESAQSWFDIEFFTNPEIYIEEKLKPSFQDFEFSGTVMSYDNSPDKWGWKITAKDSNGEIKIIFLTPGGWYEQKKRNENSEG